MSLVLYGGGVLDARGSVSGITMSRSKFGATHRAKVSPIQPGATKQGEARNLLSWLSKVWSTTLNATERAQWNSYALTAPQTNVFGQVSYLTGHQLFVRLSSNIFRTGGAISNTPPATTSEPGLVSLSLATSNGAGGTFDLTFVNPTLPGSAQLYVFATNNLSPGIYYANNQFRFIGYQALGSSPQSFITEWKSTFGGVPPISGRKQFVMAMIVDNVTGLSSAGIIASAIAT